MIIVVAQISTAAAAKASHATIITVSTPMEFPNGNTKNRVSSPYNISLKFLLCLHHFAFGKAMMTKIVIVS